MRKMTFRTMPIKVLLDCLQELSMGLERFIDPPLPRVSKEYIPGVLNDVKKIRKEITRRDRVYRFWKEK